VRLVVRRRAQGRRVGSCHGVRFGRSRTSGVVDFAVVQEGNDLLLDDPLLGRRKRVGRQRLLPPGERDDLAILGR